jgi:hypothetical protein
LSPDLNTIEDLRGIAAGKLYDREKPSVENIVGHKKRIKFVWAYIGKVGLNKLANSVPNNWIDKSDQK